MSCRKINYTNEALRTALTANILRILVRWSTSSIVFRFPLRDHPLRLPIPDMSLPIHILSVTSVFHQTYASKFKSGVAYESDKSRRSCESNWARKAITWVRANRNLSKK